MAEAEVTNNNTITDNYVNTVAGIGGGRDIATQGGFTSTKRLEFNYEELAALYESNGFAQKCIDTVPDEMTREWRTFDGIISPEEIELLTGAEETFNIVELFNNAQKSANHFGNAYLLLDVDGTGEPDEPLDINSIREGSLRSIILLDKTKMAGTKPETDPFSKNYENFSMYTPTGSQVSIHHSRVLVFSGKKNLGYMKTRKSYYDDSLLTSLYQDLRDIQAAAGVLGNLIITGTTEVWKIKNLFASIQDAETEEDMRKFISSANALRSHLNAIVTDADFDLDTITRDTTNTVEIFNLMVRTLVAKTGIPVTKFLGEAATGFQATGEGDRISYYDHVKQKQVTQFNPKLKTIDKILSLHLGLLVDADLSYTWNALFQLSAKEQAEVNKTNAETITGLVTSELIEGYQGLKELIQLGIVTNIEENYVEELERITNKVNAEIEEGEDENTNHKGDKTKVEEA